MEADEELHALLERAAKLMVKAGYRAYGVRIMVAGKREGLRHDGVQLLPGHGQT